VAVGPIATDPLERDLLAAAAVALSRQRRAVLGPVPDACG
jgi:hypothetical protein